MSHNHRPPRYPRSPFAPFSLFAPAALIEAVERLAAVTGSGHAEWEWLRAVNEHLVRVYRLVQAHPDDPVFDDPTGQAIPAFLAAAEKYLRQSRQCPLRDML